MPQWRSSDPDRAELPRNSHEAARIAGLLWEPDLVPLAVPHDHMEIMNLRTARGTDQFVDGRFWANGDWNLILRSDTGSVLGTAKRGYHPLPNYTVNAICDRLVDRFGFVWDAITTFHDGATVIYTLAHPEGSWLVRGDHSPQYPFINLINNHAGNRAFTVVPSAFRPACANVLRPWKAAARRHRLSLTVRHTRQITDTEFLTNEVFGLVERGLGQFEEFKALTDELSKADPVSPERFLNAWLPMPATPDPQAADEAVRRYEAQTRRVQRRRNAYLRVLDSETAAGDKHTPYVLWQAAIELDQHELPTRGQSGRALRNLTGGSELSDRALKVAARMASVSLA